MRRSTYDRDSTRLSEIYRAALSELERRFEIDDEAHHKLVTIVLKLYFADGGEGEADLRHVADSAVDRFVALLAPRQD
jgi:hypothetical protein